MIQFLPISSLSARFLYALVISIGMANALLGQIKIDTLWSHKLLPCIENQRGEPKMVIRATDAKKKVHELVFNKPGDLAYERTYLEGDDEGVVVAYENGKRTAKYSYKKDMPFNGTYITKNERTNYREGLKHGICEQTGAGFRLKTNFKNGKKQDKATYKITAVEWKIDTFTRFNSCLITNDLVLKIAEPDITYLVGSGTYRADRPFEGDFWTENRIEHWEKGQLEGFVVSYEVSSLKFAYQKSKSEAFKSGKMDGTVSYYLLSEFMSDPYKKTISCQYQDGKPMNGFFQKSKQDFVGVHDGQPTGSRICFSIKEDMEYRNEKPFNGFFRNSEEEGWQAHHYQNGFRTHSISEDNSITFYSGDTATTRDKDGMLTRKTIYSEPYRSGMAIGFNAEGLTLWTAYFENGMLKKGRYQSGQLDIQELVPMDWIAVGRDSIGSTVEFVVAGSKLGQKRRLFETAPIAWPIPIEKVVKDALGKFDGFSTIYFDSASGEELARLTVKHFGEGTGVEIIESIGNFIIIDHDDGNKVFEGLSFDDLLQTLPILKKK